jgi:hypothetical protein
MATFILILFLGILSFIITPWIGHLNHSKLHSTDLMAGDEGDE